MTQNKYNENIKKQKNIFGSIIARHDRGGQRTLIFNELSKFPPLSLPPYRVSFFVQVWYISSYSIQSS